MPTKRSRSRRFRRRRPLPGARTAPPAQTRSSDTHPPPRCSMRALVALALAWCAPVYAQTPDTSAVVPGVEQFLADVPAAVRGKRVGLITNHTGVDARGTSIIDRLFASRRIRLVALFGPEHGIRGTAADGGKISSSVDRKDR